MREVQNKIKLVLVSMLVSLIIINILLQFSNLDFEIQEDFHKVHVQSEHPKLIHELKKNYEGKWFGQTIKTNSLGFRDDERNLEKGNKTRIFIVGDSVTFGMKMLQDKAFPQKLEVLLNQDEEKYEVWNMGVSGYGTFEELQVIKDHLKYEPDLVILAFFQNDISNPPAFVFDKDKFLSNHKFLSKIEKTSVGKISFFKMITKTIYNKEKRAEIKVYEQKMITEKDNEQALTDIINILEQQGTDLLIINIPYINAERPYTSPEKEAIERIRSKAEVLDMLPAYQEAGPEWSSKLRVSIQEDSHPNNQGHQLLANKLYYYLKNEKNI